ncbi:hypothetical protein Tco_1259607 [Tanacetum coccineum]
MDTQQVIYAANSENRPPMLSEGNYIQRRSRLIRYTKSVENAKMLAKLILEEELTTDEVKQVVYDDQAMQLLLLGLPVEINVVVHSCESAHEMWLQV